MYLGPSPQENKIQNYNEPRGITRTIDPNLQRQFLETVERRRFDSITLVGPKNLYDLPYPKSILP